MGHNNRQNENGEITHIKQQYKNSQAEGTSSTIISLENILGDGMSETCNKILYDTYNIPITLPHIIQKYIRNMKQYNNIP